MAVQSPALSNPIRRRKMINSNIIASHLQGPKPRDFSDPRVEDAYYSQSRGLERPAFLRRRSATKLKWPTFGLFHILRARWTAQ